MGELARQPGCPELAKTPLELLTTRPGEGFTLIQKHGWMAAGVVLGLGTSVLVNRSNMKPLWSALHRHILLTLGCGYVGKIFGDLKQEASAERDEVYKHYITLHPDDFPPFERKRYADVYLPFEPYR